MKETLKPMFFMRFVYLPIITQQCKKYFKTPSLPSSLCGLVLLPVGSQFDLHSPMLCPKDHTIHGL